MFNTIWKKAWRDLWRSKLKSFTVIFAIAVSTFVLGFILVSAALLSREMNAGFQSANPHDALYKLETFSEPFLTLVKQHPQVDKAEASMVVRGRIRTVDGDWRRMQLFVLPRFQGLEIDQFQPQKGVWPPATGDLLIERQALEVLGGDVGREVVLEGPQGLGGRLMVSGSVYDVVLPQARMERLVYGYMTFTTFENLGGSRGFNTLKIALKEKPNNFNRATEAARQIEDWLETQGRAVLGSQVPVPGQHPHGFITNAVFLILKIFGMFCCLFSAMLVVSLIAANLSKQQRQIGIMKTLGATAGQLRVLGIGSVLILACMGLLLSLPGVAPVGIIFAEVMAGLLNFDLANQSIPLWIVALLLAVGLALPVLICCWPVWRSSRLSIREAFQDYGLGKAPFSTFPVGNWILGFGFLGGPLKMALRNAFRNKTRTGLNVLVLALAGAFLIAAFNLETSIDGLVKGLKQSNGWGLKINFNSPQSPDSIRDTLLANEGVIQVEPVFNARAQLLDERGQVVMPLPLTCLQTGSTMMRPPVLDGRWLGDSANEIVVNQQVIQKLPHLKLGDSVQLRWLGGIHQFRICGIVMTFEPPRAFIGDFRKSIQGAEEAKATGFFIGGAQDDRPYLYQLRRSLRKLAETREWDIHYFATPWSGIAIIESHFEIIFTLLAILTGLLVFNGINGVTLAMGTNIMERTREIGILKAIGGSRGILIGIILIEGLVTGCLSWLLAGLISFPLSYFVTSGVGLVFVQNPMPLVVSFKGFAFCLAAMPAVSALACVFPAIRTAKMPVHRALAYE